MYVYIALAVPAPCPAPTAPPTLAPTPSTQAMIGSASSLGAPATLPPSPTCVSAHAFDGISGFSVQSTANLAGPASADLSPNPDGGGPASTSGPGPAAAVHQAKQAAVTAAIPAAAARAASMQQNQPHNSHVSRPPQRGPATPAPTPLAVATVDFHSLIIARGNHLGSSPSAFLSWYDEWAGPLKLFSIQSYDWYEPILTCHTSVTLSIKFVKHALVVALLTWLQLLAIQSAFFNDTQMTTWWDSFFLSGQNVRLVTQYTKEKSLPGIATKYVCYCSERHQTHKKPRNEKAPTTSSNSTNTTTTTTATTTSSSSATGESDNCLAQIPDITSHRGQSVRLSYPPQASSLLSGLGEKSNVQPFRLTCLPRVSTTCATSREGKYISSSGSNLTRVSHCWICVSQIFIQFRLTVLLTRRRYQRLSISYALSFT